MGSAQGMSCPTRAPERRGLCWAGWSSALLPAACAAMLRLVRLYCCDSVDEMLLL